MLIICLSIYSSIYVLIHTSIHPSNYLVTHPFIHLSMHSLSIYPYIYQLIHPAFNPSLIHTSFNPSIRSPKIFLCHLLHVPWPRSLQSQVIQFKCCWVLTVSFAFINNPPSLKVIKINEFKNFMLSC